MNVLIVDDQPINLKLLRAQLEADGANVSEATDGLEALDVLKCVQVDAIISDIQMPRMNGYQLCTEVRSASRSCNVPFIAYSATYTSALDEKLMLEMGADCFLRKPSSPALIASTLRNAVGAKPRPGETGHRVKPKAERLNQYNEWRVMGLEEKSGELEEEVERLTYDNELLLTTNRELKRVIEFNPAMMYGLKWKKQKIELRVVGNQVAQWLGFEAAEILNYDWWLGRVHPADQGTVAAIPVETLARGASCTEYRVKRKDGSIRWVEDRRRVIESTAGNSVEFTGVWSDITVRRAIEYTAREQRGQWEMTIATAMNALIIVQEGKLVLVNPAAVRLFGAEDENQLLAAKMSDLFSEDDFASLVVKAEVEEPWAGGAHPVFAQKLRRMDGSVAEVQLGAVYFPFQARPALLIEAREQDGDRRSGSRLMLQHAVTAALAEETPISKINQAFLAALVCGLGWDFGELWMGDPHTQRLACTDTWHLPSSGFVEFAAATRGLVFDNGQELPGKVWASGRTQWCVDLAGEQTSPRHARAVQMGLRGWVGFPVKRGGEVVGVVGFFGRTVTRPDAELLEFFETCGLQIGQLVANQKLANQFRQAQKINALGMLAGGIAHDFNNILGAIYRYCEMARMEGAGNVLLAEHLDGLMKGARRATALVGRILAFSGGHEEGRRPIELWPVATEALQLLRAALPAMVEFEIELSKDAPVVLADATQIHQIIMNLGINAAHAMRENGGYLTIKLENCQIDASFGAATPDLHEGRYARITMRDTGHGMDAVTLSRTFEPFFTTKPPGEGTGLGLSVVHDIVRAHDGAITVSSVQGEGTAFQIYFPAHIQKVDESSGWSASLPRGSGERILFVDDEVRLTDVGQQLLNCIGYRTDTCATGDAALALVRADPAAYSLVITDQVMPGMSGIELAKCLKKIRPELPVILVTGEVDGLPLDRLATMGIREFLSKPVSVQTLADVVHQTLVATVK